MRKQQFFSTLCQAWFKDSQNWNQTNGKKPNLSNQNKKMRKIDQKKGT
ncbi:MAG: hypothetical protein M1445_13565 [Bacteroidetes bacterium]|nr:hypothetical protein [Bacteroidota bacterium]